MANISGREVMRLLRLEGWTEGGRRTHGVFFSKHFPGETIPRSTIVPDKVDPLPEGTLGAILGVEQTGLGKTGLEKLLERHGRK